MAQGIRSGGGWVGVSYVGSGGSSAPGGTINTTATMRGTGKMRTILGVDSPITLDDVLAAILAPSTQVLRHADIYEYDGETPWRLNVPITEGTISVDASRDERRTLDITFSNIDGRLPHSANDGLWYDKIVKVYRGVVTKKGPWETQIGEFVLDAASSDNHPKLIKATGRDYTARLLDPSKFPRDTSFNKGQAIEDVIRTIAINGGIRKFNLPITGRTLGDDYFFDKGTERFKAMQKIADSFGYDLYFDRTGFLVMAEYQDPLYSPELFTFTAGPGGSIERFTKKSDNARLYNHVVARSTADTGLGIVAEALNENPSSPSRIERIGDRLYEFESPFFNDEAQAQDVANKFLAVHSLEEFEINMDTLVLPWLEANTVLRFVDPVPEAGVPDRYLLHDFSVPLGLDTMPVTGKRVTTVG